MTLLPCSLQISSSGISDHCDMGRPEGVMCALSELLDLLELARELIGEGLLQGLHRTKPS